MSYNIGNYMKYLDCPFHEKDECKKLGAKWDPSVKKWYVPEGLDIQLFAKWIEDGNRANLKEEKKTTEKTPEKNKQESIFRLNWKETNYRAEWIVNYLNIGSIPFAFKKLLNNNITNLYKGFGQLLILKNRELIENLDFNQSQSAQNIVVPKILKKILLRGHITNNTINLENSIINYFKLDKILEKEDEESFDIGWNNFNKTEKISHKNLQILWSKRNSFNLGVTKELRDNNPDALFDSELEINFLELLGEKLDDKSFSHWLIPQVPLDILISSKGLAARRIDFLLCHPLLNTVAIEIDGVEHEDSKIDEDREKELNTLNIKTIRIKNDEIKNKKGPNLDKFIEFLNKEIKTFPKPDNNINFLKACITSNLAGQLQYVITEALEDGFLNIKSNNWYIKIIDNNDYEIFYTNAILDILQIIKSISQIYSLEFNLEKANILINEKEYVINLLGSNIEKVKVSSNIQLDIEKYLRINIDDKGSPYSKVENETAFHYIMKPVCIPGVIINENYSPKNFTTSVTKDINAFKGAANLLLQQIFRKKSLFEEQVLPIKRLISGNDTIVLLPTGSGKSLIYQLSGLIMPGITLVIDPIIALIRDQEKSMKERYGIDKVKGLSSLDFANEQDGKEIISLIAKGEYYFLLVSPERLQNQTFRGALGEIAFSSHINLAVIDEAHCVSEWGHDFRPSYLHLPNNLRKFCKSSSGDVPPIAALTGTASRSVLRDILIDIDISNSDSNAIIRPKSFDRKEIQFQIIKNDEKINDTATSLKRVIKNLPKEFNSNLADFFRPRGKKTSSGIIFVPTVKNKKNGVISVQNISSSASNTNPLVFSGTNPYQSMDEKQWNKTKFENMDAFLDNEESLLVATKAFGMGIDKPNIRYTVHYGMPGSIENFYQEAGRSGRDKKKSLSIIIYTEYESEISDKILDPNIKLEDISELTKKIPITSNDDLSTQIFMHTLTFKGWDKEIEETKKVVELLYNLSKFDMRATVEIPKPFKDDYIEKTLMRLLRIGVVEDYLVDFGAKKYIVFLERYNDKKCKSNLLNYISANQPGMKRAFKELLDKTPEDDNKQAVWHLIKVFIKFTYEHIEKARRRAISEAMLLGRTCKTDGEIRSQILSYLQEGLAPETIEEWLKGDEVDLKKIEEYLNKALLSSSDAEEIRGNMIRLIESYPNHPVLVVLRGLTELLIKDTNENQYLQNLEAGFSFAILNYKISENKVLKCIENIWNMLENNKNLKIYYHYGIKKLWENNSINFNEEPSFFDDTTEIINPSLELIKTANIVARDVMSKLNDVDVNQIKNIIGR